MIERIGIAVTLGVISATILSAATPTAKVRLYAVDPFGHGLGSFQVVRFVEPRIGGKDYTSLFHGSEADGIPYGTYVVGIRAGKIGIGGNVHVDQPDTFAVLAGSGKFTEGGVPLTGRITGIPKGTSQPVWIKIMYLYEDDSCCTTLLLDAANSFSTGVLIPGLYLLTVMHDGGVLCSGAVGVGDYGAKIEVNLASGTITSQNLKAR